MSLDEVPSATTRCFLLRARSAAAGLRRQFPPSRRCGAVEAAVARRGAASGAFVLGWCSCREEGGWRGDDEEEEVAQEKRGGPPLTTPASFGRHGDLGCRRRRCELPAGAASAADCCFLWASPPLPKEPGVSAKQQHRRFPRRRRCCRVRASFFSGVPVADSERPPRRSRPCTCLPSTTSAWCSSAGVRRPRRDLLPAAMRDRPVLLSITVGGSSRPTGGLTAHIELPNRRGRLGSLRARPASLCASLLAAAAAPAGS